MDIDSMLKKVRMQIKFGRAVEAEQNLELLRQEFTGTDKEALVLSVYALEFLRKIEDYRNAIPLLQRLLVLNIDDSTREEAVEFLRVAEEKEGLKESEPDMSSLDFQIMIEAVRNREIFLPADDFSPPEDWFVVQGIAVAKELAWNQGVNPPFQSWNALRTNAAREVHKYYFENKIKLSNRFDEVANEIMKICDESLSPIMMHFYDDIYGDLSIIAMGKIVGVVPDLHAKMWEAYQSKSFPCGWRGDYSRGQLCVFPNA